MLFWILIKLTLYLSWLAERNPWLRKTFNSESTAYFLDETFYHTHMPLSSRAISAATVIKVTKYSKYYIIHNSNDVATKFQLWTLKLAKLSYLVGSVDKNNIYFTWPACCQNIENFCHWVITHLSNML